MLPSQRYNEILSRKRYLRDPTQEHAIVLLDAFCQSVLERKRIREAYFLKRLAHQLFFSSKDIKGFYLWGGVGRGKTFLMDLLYDVLPIKNKKRLHYHHFMRDIHHRLSLVKNEKNPLYLITKQLSKEFSVLCLDEFMVTDIGDAMVLSELLSGMQKHGIALITTSNTAPENLYLDGLQRSQFLKTIDHINEHCHVLHVDGGVDYRVQLDFENRGYFYPDLQLSRKKLEQYIADQNLIALDSDSSIVIQSRQVQVAALYESAIWFEFDELCKTNRSRSDYIEITERFSTVFITGLSSMNDQSNDVTRRFITLIDVFYDAKIDLVLTADVAVDQLYEGKFLVFEFCRTLSRLVEMQSVHYSARS